MLIGCFWRDCGFRSKQWGAKAVDAFWVEATQTDAEIYIFPRLEPPAIAESRELAVQAKELTEYLGNPARPFCFLVARDLSSIDPFPVDYPFSHMWNAYSPFESMPETAIASLDELQNLDLP